MIQSNINNRNKIWLGNLRQNRQWLKLSPPNIETSFGNFYSQKAHLNYLTMGSFRGHSVGSQWTHKMNSHCELAVSVLWVCNSHSELTSLLPLHSELNGMISQIVHLKLTVRDASSWKADRKLSGWVILRVHCELTECPQNEPTISFNVSSQCVTCELKFFTGWERNFHIFQYSLFSTKCMQMV